MMKISISTLVSSALLVAAAGLPLLAHAGFIGDQATLTFSNTGFTSPVLFTSPQTVGTGVEFTGTGTDLFGNDWTMTGDVFDNGITLAWSSSSGPYTNISIGPDAYAFDLNFASSIVTPFHLVSLTSTLPLTGNGFLTNLNLTGPHSVHFGFETLISSQSYTFMTATPIPEPGNIALFGLGLLAIVVSGRKFVRYQRS